MEWFYFALGFTSCGFLMSSLAVLYIMGKKEEVIDLDDFQIHGPFSIDEAMEDLAKVEKEVKKNKKETKNVKGSVRDSKVSEIKPKS